MPPLREIRTATKSADAVSHNAEGPDRPADPFVVCTVHDAFAYTGSYKVRTPYGDTRQAVQAIDASATPIGATEFTQILPGDVVLCYFPVGFPYGFVIKVLTPLCNDPRFQIPDSIVARSRVGLIEDKTHHTPYENTENRLINASLGRPLDTLPGDWGVVNEFGLAIFLGKLMAAFKASDLAKIEAFWGDNLLRIFGWNTQQWTAACEHFSFDDEGEYSEITRSTPFMWESLGAYEAGNEIFEKNEGDDGGNVRGSEKAYCEPKEKKQIMVFRDQHLRGYLGDISREQVVTRPPEAPTDPAKQDDPQDYRGLLEIHTMLDGTYAVRSSKQIILEKSLMLPVPWQKRDPDDPEGDHAADPNPNYKAANYYGSGDTQEKKPYEWSDEENPMIRNNELWEQEEYLFGKFGLQALDAHEEDWETAEAADVKMSESESENIIDETLFSPKMDFEPFKELPKYAEVTIDQRDGYDTRYYRSRSCVHMLDDGSIVLEDGYGSQIVMSGGNIEITCQGDVFTRPGRNAITWAPRDIIQRAGWCAELTAAKKDVRIKGENNVHVYAGDGNKGNILLECRSSNDPIKTDWEGNIGEDIESRGIILKCEEAAIDIWSDWRVFVGASKEANGIVEVSSGLGRTTIAGKDVGVEATAQFGVLVGAARSATGTPVQFGMDTSSAYMVATRFDIDANVGVWTGSLGGGLLETERGMSTKASILANGSMACSGSMAANGMISNSIHNGVGGGRGPNITSRGGQVTAEAAKQVSLLYSEFDNVTLDNSVVGQGNKDVQDSVGFSFRKTLDHYKIEENFRIIEARWQQMYRAFGVNSEKWEEPQVDAPDGTPTRPHPGYDAWDQGTYYKYSDPSASKNVDYEKGQAKTREDQSEQAPSLTDAALASEYVINVQQT